MRIIGIDPGVTGALAVLVADPMGAEGPGPSGAEGPGPSGAEGLGPWRLAAVYDLPAVCERTSAGKARRYIDPVALAALLEQIGPVDRCIVERLSAPPGISGIAAYSLGATAATIATVLALSGMRPRLISPATWKRAMEVPKEKNAARDYASLRFGTAEYWPRKLHHNRAEAALIALYGALA